MTTSTSRSSFNGGTRMRNKKVEGGNCRFFKWADEELGQNMEMLLDNVSKSITISGDEPWKNKFACIIGKHRSKIIGGGSLAERMSFNNAASGSNPTGSFSLMNAHERDATKVACIMLATMTAELQKSNEKYYPFEMHHDLMDRYHQIARQERYEIISSMITTRMKDCEPVTGHKKKMQRYVDRLLKLNVNFRKELAIDIILHSLPSCYDQFRMTYHMNKEEVTLSKLQGLLKTTESGLKGKLVVTTPTSTAGLVLAIGQGKGKKRKSPSKGTKGKTLDGSSLSGTKKGFFTPSANPKEAECFYCHEKSHWKRNCPKYLQDVKDGKVKPNHAGTKKK
uniref:CCHC-type domain-containing protein n=1 Tax=Lactuca sativa TaxID=4236 RepID=A0A9R1XEZ5_LACSA|nr:hypothetical protein LSAT_V11C400165970 [Lactuca sativa]